MSLLEALLVVIAGFVAGGMNAIAGSGSLVTFPTLLAVGYSPVVANVSNSIGLVFGGVSGSVGYRRELVGQRRRFLTLACASATGGTLGAVLLLTLPSDVFKAVVPVLIVIALVLVVLQTRLQRWVVSRRTKQVAHGGLPLFVAVFLVGVYGGYFGAAQGIMLIALLGTFLAEALQRVNALKNTLATTANVVAASVFLVSADIAWGPVVLLAGGSIVGGAVGARYGRRLRPAWLRAFAVAVGIAAIVKLLAT